ncbi:MAG: hypothetical protein MUF48_24160 [Pirellulaceae bacterium]|nr:hypothetical protein [Pirellulaceae bacterium]
MTASSNTHADQPCFLFLWEALSLGSDARRAASRDDDRIMRALDQFQELDSASHALRVSSDACLSA